MKIEEIIEILKEGYLASWQIEQLLGLPKYSLWKKGVFREPLPNVWEEVEWENFISTALEKAVIALKKRENQKGDITEKEIAEVLRIPLEKVQRIISKWYRILADYSNY
jgi:hypothetical protein